VKLGVAPIVDFDGTLADLQVPWDQLRSQLAVDRIQDLWSTPSDIEWTLVTEAEVRAAHAAPSLPLVTRCTNQTHAMAILTNNSERAVEQFLARFPDLRARVLLIVGRETLGGPKDEFDVFEAGFQRCAAATAEMRDGAGTVYVGDQAYELRFAARLGAHALHVSEVGQAHA